ncbi:FtsX-like permease family protein [Paenibacillus sp. Marseille-Q4541]|uniref:ABC transporter permease n=1 Tax=Paenibacillus sp. Marseille-Q4541 TaxID=2831522 RepID=UPI001BA6B862|nr:FtsX-like permease family protein [Paenibacillus sp. Marseille-Q4541]
MYIFKNAIKNIGRNKGRNLLIGVVLVIIAITCVISLVINSATSSIITDYKNQFGSEVNVELDYSKLYEDGITTDFPEVTLDQLKKYASSEYVKDYYFYLEAPAVSKKINAINQEGNAEVQGSANAEGGGPDIGPPNLKVIGSSSYELFEEFKKGERKIIEGKIFEKDDEIVISENLAQKNSLKVGDVITIRSIADANKDITLTITGIYKDLTKDNTGDFAFKDPYMTRNNEILTTYETATRLVGKQANTMSRIKYFLHSPSDLDVFVKDAQSKGLSKYYSLTNNEYLYKQIAGPVESVQKISTVFLIVVLILGGIILVLLNLIALRERKYEIGVLRAIGMKKTKVIKSLLYESIVVTMLAITVGLGVGSFAAQPISDKLLADQIEQRQEQMENMGGNLGGSGVAMPNTDEIINSLHVKLDACVILAMFLIGSLLVIISNSMSLVYITKYEPIKILSERN